VEPPSAAPHVAAERPRLRGVWHLWAFVLSIPLGVVLAASADSSRARVAAAVFAVSVAAMFGASALYHRVTWTPRQRVWMRRLDHVGIYGLIAGTYTPFGLLALEGTWRTAVLAFVWTGALAASGMRLFWPSGPKWPAAAVSIGLGWVGIVALPELLDGAGLGAVVLVLVGGLFYTVGALVYVFKRPNPSPGVFAYHEVFHALVTVAVAFQYVAVALVVNRP
jgi:hemolysin III